MPVRGARQTSANLRSMAQYVSVPLNAASRFALRPTLATAKANAKSLPTEEKTGTLAASLTVKRDPRSPKLAPKHKVGPDAGYERQTQYGVRKPVKYAHLLEFGTAPHFQPGRGVTHPGSRATPFLEPAFHATKDQVVRRFGSQIGIEMEKRAARMKKK